MKLLLNLLFLTIFLGACQSQGNKDDSQASQKDTSELSESSAGPIRPARNKDYKRIVTVGNEATSLFLSLSDSARLVAIGHSHPKYPDLDLPKVGFKEALQAKALLLHQPDLVIGDSENLPSEVIEVLNEKKIEYFLLNQEANLESIQKNIQDLSTLLKAEKTGKKLLSEIDRNLKALQKIRGARKDTARVLYVLARGPRVLLYGGAATPSDLLIRLSGSKNAAGDYEGLERLTFDELNYINPDYLLISDKSVASFEGRMYNNPILTSSRAYRTGRMIVLGDYELNHLCESISVTALDLTKKIYQQQYYAPLPVKPEAPVSRSKPDKIEIIDNK